MWENGAMPGKYEEWRSSLKENCLFSSASVLSFEGRLFPLPPLNGMAASPLNIRFHCSTFPLIIIVGHQVASSQGAYCINKDQFFLSLSFDFYLVDGLDV